jgi:hypothetical protein
MKMNKEEAWNSLNVPENVHWFLRDYFNAGWEACELEMQKELDELKYKISCHKIIKKMRKERPFDDE